MKRFLWDLWATFLFFLMIALGLLLTVGVLRFLESVYWQNAVENALGDAPFIENVDTAVKIVGGLFTLTWSLRFLDQTFLKNRLAQNYALNAGGGFKTSRLFIFPFLHGDYTHLKGNTFFLLLFVGLTVLMIPDMRALLLATVTLLVAQGLGVFLFGAAGRHLGASGLVLGFFALFVSYGLLIAGGMWRAAAAIVLLTCGYRMFRTLTNRQGNGSVAGHFWGLMGGVLAAWVLSALVK